eukprot:gene19488-60249_t
MSHDLTVRIPEAGVAPAPAGPLPSSPTGGASRRPQPRLLQECVCRNSSVQEQCAQPRLAAVAAMIRTQTAGQRRAMGLLCDERAAPGRHLPAARPRRGRAYSGQHTEERG